MHARNCRCPDCELERIPRQPRRPARIRTRCCICHKLIHDGPEAPGGGESHGVHRGRCENVLRRSMGLEAIGA
jgi:hypothetical protein